MWVLFIEQAFLLMFVLYSEKKNRIDHLAVGLSTSQITDCWHHRGGQILIGFKGKKLLTLCARALQ